MNWLSKSTWIACLALLATMPAHAASPLVDNSIRYVGTYGNGIAYILFHSPIPEPGCESSEVRIPANHPEKKSIIALALTAAQTGAIIGIRTEGCWNGYPLFGETTNSALMVWAQ